MTDSQHRQIEELFAALSGLSPGERAASLAAVNDLEVRAEVASLLEFSSPATTATQVPVLGAAIANVVRAAEESGAFVRRQEGSQFGHYSIVRHLGHGGMGDVYEAVRDDDFHKRVALKIVRRGLEVGEGFRRFQRERQLLANLEHPNIARLLDGGSQGGIPYLVLEFVEGLPVDRYCEGKDRGAILRLFLRIAEAVEYAHRNLIVHRDLKPANILVTSDGTPKLLDFGIAKLVEDDATQTAMSCLTPQYASPEQVRGGSITTASDVYSLGVILYGLLAGKLPYKVSTTSPLEIDRAVCQVDPPKPGISEDLDNIIMMALRKDPARRYSSVREFADDVQRSLSHKPVLARPDTWMYRAGKFVRRNRLALAAGVLVAAAIAGGALASRYQALRAEKRFNEVRQLANRFLFDFDDSIKTVQGTTKARELVVKTALEHLGRLEEDARGDLGIAAEIAAAYEKVGDIQGLAGSPNLGRPLDALQSYRKGREIDMRRLQENPNDFDTIRGMIRKTVKAGEMLQRSGNSAEALRALESCVQPGEQLLARNPVRNTYVMMGSIFGRLTDLQLKMRSRAEALESARKNLSAAEGQLRVSPGDRAGYNHSLALLRVGNVLRRLDRTAEATEHYRRAQEILSRLQAAQPDDPLYRHNLAVAYARLSEAAYDATMPNPVGRQQAIEHLQRALALAEQDASRDKDDATATAVLSEMLQLQGRLLLDTDAARGDRQIRRGSDLLEGLIVKSPGQADYLQLKGAMRIAQAVADRKMGRGARAEEALREAVELTRKLAAKDPDDEILREQLGEAYALLGNSEEALRQWSPLAQKHPDEPRFARLVSSLRPQR